MERTYLSANQMEGFLQKIIISSGGIQSSLLRGQGRLKKLNFSFNNMSSVPSTTLAKFVINLEQVEIFVHFQRIYNHAHFQVKLNYCALNFDQIEAIFAEVLDSPSLKLKSLEMIAYLSTTMADEAVNLARLETRLVLARKVVPRIKFTMVRPPSHW